MSRHKLILPIIVIAQFCCTSLWFAGNGVIDDLISSFQLEETSLGYLTSAIQFGFIIGTLSFAILTIADRFSPSKVFFFCSLMGSALNLGIIMDGNTLLTLLIVRFLTGFFLAGIYPIGMKIAADYFQQGLGKSLGYLVGALVLGTALPHLLKGITADISWEYIITFISGLALVGGLLLVLLVPDGPYRKKSQKPDLSQWLSVFRNRNFRAAAFGYFGHMWELYAFWAFVPVIISYHLSSHATSSVLDVSILSFIVIGIGSIGCIAAGYLSHGYGAKRIATLALTLSLLCCLLSPLVIPTSSTLFLITFLLFWGFVVIADSPLFSTLVAQNANAESKGTALTIVNCIGFSITIVSISLLNLLRLNFDLRFIFLILAIGPIFGLLSLQSKSR